VDHKNEDDILKIISDTGQFVESDLGGRKGHDENEAWQNVPFKGGSIVSKEEPETECEKKDEVTIFKKTVKKSHFPFHSFSLHHIIY
jgi:hypothetical protein